MRILRRVAKRTVAWLAGGLVRWLARPQGGQVRRVLVIRIDERVGNVLLTTPLLRSLRSKYEVTLLVAANKTKIVQGLCALIPFDKKLLFRRPWAFLRLLADLRRQRFDAAIDASHWHHFSLSSALLLAWTGAPLRISHQRGAAESFANHLIPAPDRPEYEISSKLRLLAPLGLEGSPAMETALGSDPAVLAKAEAWLAAASLAPKGWIALLPGGRKPDHRLPTEVFARIARAAKVPAVVFWGPGEQVLAEELAQAAGGMVAPPTDLDALAAFLRLAAAIVANDTGTTHLAVACGTPTIALFREADPERWGHRGLGHHVFDSTAMSEDALVTAASEAIGVVLAHPVPV